MKIVITIALNSKRVSPKVSDLVSGFIQTLRYLPGIQSISKINKEEKS